jgi:hypothetical protein
MAIAYAGLEFSMLVKEPDPSPYRVRSNTPTERAQEETDDASNSQDGSDSEEPTVEEVEAEFNKKFRTEADLWRVIFEVLLSAGLVICRRCKAVATGGRFYKQMFWCEQCNKKGSYTAGTFFHGIRNPRLPLLAICFLEAGLVVNDLQFSHIAKTAYSNAWRWMNKIRVVIREQLGKDALLLSSALFASAICKRSRETEARRHPFSEQEEIDRQFAESNDSSNEKQDLAHESEIKAEDTVLFDERDKDILELLSNESVSIDQLCQRSGMQMSAILLSITNLELAGLATRSQGNQFSRTQSIKRNNIEDDTSETITDKAKTITDFIRSYFHGVSRKYLQNFIAAFWCRTDRITWGPQCLLNACGSAPYASGRQNAKYVSPALIYVPA